jgi:deazaflavin-dependent oxidoreductase (nitroreductase family)
MQRSATPTAKLPPPWFIHFAWRFHRALYRITGGRVLWMPGRRFGWGAMRLTTTGWKTGRERSVIIGYLEDGPNILGMAMNGWDEGHPAWWRNLQAHPDAVIRLPHGEPMAVRAREAFGEERERLWARWQAVDEGLDAYAARRTVETPMVVFEPVDRGDR